MGTRDENVNRFRQRRGRVLGRLINGIATAEQRSIRILDIGGRAEYWNNIPADSIDEVVLLNHDRIELGEATAESGVFRRVVGDALDLGQFADQSIDLVHSNSVIEHVGTWPEMSRMASEARRVGRAGWIQTPAWEFPIEPHFRAPFVHWFGRPVQRGLLRVSSDAKIRRMTFSARRAVVDRVNLLSRSEVEALFPNDELFVERFALLPKSYCVYWTASSRGADVSVGLKGKETRRPGR